jgi:hypothetical protein
VKSVVAFVIVAGSIILGVITAWSWILLNVIAPILKFGNMI